MQNINGWVKVHRKIWDNPYMSKPAYLSVWMYLITHAQHTEKDTIFNGKRITLKPGQLVTGRLAIEKATGVNNNTVRYILGKFTVEQQIQQQTCSGSTLITIKNWRQYQKVEQQIQQPFNNHLTTIQQPINTIEELKKDKNVKNEKKEATQKPPEFSGKETKLQRQYKDGTVALYELGCLSDSDRETEWYTESMRYYDGIREEDLDHVRFPIRLRGEPLKSVILYLAFSAKRFSTRERSHVKAFIRGICNPHNDFWRRFCDSTEQALGSLYDIIDEAPRSLES